jgi:hypothetical protein
MERVSFLIEESGERVPCMLNPDSVVLRRRAGVRPAAAQSGWLTRGGTTDDPLLQTGGGRTELDLELLFDVTLLPPATPVAPAVPTMPGAGAEPVPAPERDVRSLTRPLWELTENRAGEDGVGRMSLVRFVWGKPWCELGLIVALAERLEYFTAGGTPQRSWLRLRLVRVAEPAPPPAGPDGLPLAAATADVAPPFDPAAEPQVYEVTGTGPAAGTGEPSRGERLDVIAARMYGGRWWLWRVIAAANDLPEPPWVPPGTVLRIPPVLPTAGPEVLP